MNYVDYFDHSERLAIEHIAARVNEDHDGSCMDWSAYQITNPKQRRFRLSHNQGRFGLPSYDILHEGQQFIEFREFLKSFSPFVRVKDYRRAHHQGWTSEVACAANKRGLSAFSGSGWTNKFSFRLNKRVADEIVLLRIEDPKSGIYTELLELDDVTVKILMIRNPRSPAPFAMRRFCRILKSVLIQDCSYRLAYGHPAEVDDPDHTHNCETDKRFIKRETRLLDNAGGKAQEFEISNLSKFWEIMGFKLIASPEYERVAAAMM